MKKEIGIYIHIPFCVRKCNYCDFLSGPATDGTKERYIRALLGEMEQSKALGERYEVATIFLGGGTPSVLEAEAVRAVLDKINHIYTVQEAAEITIECNPGTVTREKLLAYKEAGINRLSFGLQSTENMELKLLGRIHTYEEFLENYKQAREVGFTNINIDLMSALPGQTAESWKESLNKVSGLRPEHVSAYSLIVEEGTPFYEKYGDESPVSEDTERQMYHDTKVILKQYGYERYEISNYAEPGYECRHNLSYWERKDYKGYGIGAASLIEKVRYKNSEHLEEYNQGIYSYESEEILTKQEELEEYLFLGLRKMEGVLLTEEVRAVYQKVLEKMKNQGLITELVYQEGKNQGKTGICLTERGIDISNYVFSEFLIDQDE